MKRTLLTILLVCNGAMYPLAAHLYKEWAVKEIAETEEGGRVCDDEYHRIRQRIQDVIDAYNKADREADEGMGGFIR